MQQIGRYQILGELGRGAMGVVYRAQDPAIGRTIAIKTIRLADLTDPSERERLRERLFREAQSAGILSHPNIVTIYDIQEEEEGVAHIFMELVNGPTLEKLLGDEQAPTRETIIQVFRQTASALDYAHRKGIIHRDIKPANIMIDDDGAAKITDFGVAKIQSSQMTQSGTMMGTPSYMSPEQVQGGSVDGRADEFSLAVIVYEVLTGEKPFVAEYLPSLLYKIVKEDPTAPQRLNPTLGAEVEFVMRRALAKTPAERFETCSEFIRELEAACNVRPNWVALPRGASQTMPTVASSGPVVFEPPKAVPAPPPAAAAIPAASVPPRMPVRSENESHTVRNVVFALAAVIVLGLILLIAQRPNTTEAPQTAQTEEPKAPAEQQKPSAVPPTASQPADDAAAQKPSDTTTRETTEPEKTAPEKPAPDKPKPVPVPVQESRPANAPGSVPVQISTAPGGAKINIDGLDQCTSPCSLPLERGRHVVAVRLDGFREARRVIEVPQESALTVDLDRVFGTLSVSSTPPGAEIILNGQTRAEKTPAVLKLPVGSYRLQVAKDSIKTDEETVQITDGGMSQRRYKLE